VKAGRGAAQHSHSELIFYFFSDKERTMRMFESGRSALKALLMSAFLLLGMAGFSTQASAQSLNCTGTVMTTLSPPLTNTQRETQVATTGSYSPCLVTGVSGITSGTVNYQVTRDYSCNTLLGSGSGTTVIQWSNGQSSTFSYTTVTNEVEGNFVIVSTGNISSGLFQNQSAVRVSTLTSLSAADFLTACEGSGITSVSGPSTWTILAPL
jgi:hypothetical protein